MVFSVRIKRSALAELRRVPRPYRDRIAAAMDGLAKNPLQGTVLKGRLRGLRRLRIGRYRVVYEVEKEALVVLVIRVAGRAAVYRSVPRG